MATRHVLPWGEEFDSVLLDNLYLSRSGSKYQSPIFKVNEIPDGWNANAIVDTLFFVYNQKWSKLWEIHKLDYDPIQNYNSVETESYTKTNDNSITKNGESETTNTGTVTNASEESGTNTGTTKVETNTTQIEDGTNSNTNNNSETNTGSVEDAKSIYGFNAGTATNSDKNVRTDNLTKTVAETQTQNIDDTVTTESETTTTNNLTDSKTSSNTETLNTKLSGLTNDFVDEDLKETFTRSFTRKGNIGVTTSQQMANSSIEFWMWNFFNNVMEDIDRLLTLSVY